jgi:prevent-host-death family protein
LVVAGCAATLSDWDTQFRRLARAQGGTPTIITRNGQAVAAVVPIEDFYALEDAIDRYLAREADRDLAENPDAPTYSMSEVVAAIFEEEPGQGAA